MEKKKTLMSATLLLFFSLLGGGSAEDVKFHLYLYGITFVVIGVFIAVVYSVFKKSRREKIKKAMDSTSDFDVSIKITDDDRYVFAVDNNRRKVMIINVDKKELLSQYFIDFADIISVELLEDSKISFSKSTTRIIGGGIAGGVIAGGAGAIIGGLSGDSKLEKKVSSLQVKILVRNQNIPSHIIDCFVGFPCDICILHNEMEKAKRIIDHISVIIDMMDREYQQELATSKTEMHSIADELEKLCILKEKGILSNAEFEQQKEKLLP